MSWPAAEPEVMGIRHDMTMGLAKDTVTGGTASLNVRSTPHGNRFDFDPMCSTLRRLPPWN